MRASARALSYCSVPTITLLFCFNRISVYRRAFICKIFIEEIQTSNLIEKEGKKQRKLKQKETPERRQVREREGHAFAVCEVFYGLFIKKEPAIVRELQIRDQANSAEAPICSSTVVMYII